jgi:hypothetical protein
MVRKYKHKGRGETGKYPRELMDGLQEEEEETVLNVA